MPMPRKTADLYVVYMVQPSDRKAAPYRDEWRELSVVGGSRSRVPPDGWLVEDKVVAEGSAKRDSRVWLAFGISASRRAGAPCVAICLQGKLGLRKGDVVSAKVDLMVTPEERPKSFGLWPLIDHGEFARHYRLMVAALPAVWKVKKAAKA